MSWIDRLVPKFGGTSRDDDSGESVWIECPSCSTRQLETILAESFHVCPNCGHHLRIGARTRLDYFLDPGQRVEIGNEHRQHDPLKFVDTQTYVDRLTRAAKRTGEKEALLVQAGKLLGRPVCVAAFEFGFLGGSMGSVVGRRFQAASDYALEHGIPLICFATSGGARMQESMLSLVQMARTAASVERLNEAGIPYISVLVDPVYGGVSASLAILGDVNIAEPKALVGFTGPRVIEQNTGVKLPPGFQRSEFLLEHGSIDMIVERGRQREVIAHLLNLLAGAHAELG
ncbi:MAG: acetyl-CoA carboxylase, carboxyltransferase subunit beta [Gammaproteobacteria bacterium AqS3]|nr:acetyl-CoA carboxylase, carboxyltransferase subunit beta [Gammaproteobacteria bacterium AqS3]